MFDGIIKNMISDAIKGAALIFAGWLGLQPNSTMSNEVVAAFTTLGTALWFWYENKGQQQINDLFKKVTETSSLPVAKSIAQNRVISAIACLMFMPFLYVTSGHAQIFKTPPLQSSPCSAVTCTGPYAGGEIGNGIVMGDAGAQFWNGVAFLGVEAGIGGQVYTDPALTVSRNGFFAYEIMKAGGSYYGLFGNVPAPPTNTPSILAQVIAPYGFAGAVERDILSSGLVTGWTIGGGTEFDVSAHSFVDVKYFYNSYGGNKIPSESLVMAGWNYKF